MYLCGFLHVHWEVSFKIHPYIWTHRFFNLTKFRITSFFSTCFFFSFQYYSHTMQFTHLKHTIQWLLHLQELYNHHNSQFWNVFISPKKKSCTYQQSFSISPSNPPILSNYYSAPFSVDLHILDILFNRICIICSLL